MTRVFQSFSILVARALTTVTCHLVVTTHEATVVVSVWTARAAARVLGHTASVPQHGHQGDEEEDCKSECRHHCPR